MLRFQKIVLYLSYKTLRNSNTSFTNKDKQNKHNQYQREVKGRDINPSMNKS